MNVYPMSLKNENGETVHVALRLTTGGQMRLEEKYPDRGSLSLMFTDSVIEASDVLTESLHFKGNANTVKDGEELLDLMIDNGISGVLNRQKLLIEIARVSGMVSDGEYRRVKKELAKLIASASGEDEDADEAEDAEKNA